jgi:hypothetical protein
MRNKTTIMGNSAFAQPMLKLWDINFAAKGNPARIYANRTQRYQRFAPRSNTHRKSLAIYNGYTHTVAQRTGFAQPSILNKPAIEQDARTLHTQHPSKFF